MAIQRGVNLFELFAKQQPGVALIVTIFFGPNSVAITEKDCTDITLRVLRYLGTDIKLCRNYHPKETIARLRVLVKLRVGCPFQWRLPLAGGKWVRST